MEKEESKTPISKRTSGDQTCSSTQRRAELYSGASSSVSPFLTQRRIALTPHQPHCETEELLAFVPEFDRKHLDSPGSLYAAQVCMFSEWKGCIYSITRSPKRCTKLWV